MLAKPLINVLIKHDEEGNKIESPKPDKQYLLLIVFNELNGEDSDRTFIVITGRKETSEYIKDHIEEIDIVKSQILSETSTFMNSVSIYTFMRFYEENIEHDEEFNIEEYLEDDIDGDMLFTDDSAVRKEE